MLKRARAGLQTLIAFGGVAALEILFFVLWRLANLKLYVIEAIAVCFAAGIVYLLALFFFEHTAESRAALFKSFPLLLFPAWLREAGWPRSLRAWAGGIAAAAFAAVCFWPYRSALQQIPANMAYFETRWRDNNSSLYALLTMFSGSPDLAAGLGVGVAAGIAIWAAARRAEPLRAAYLIIGAVLMLTPNAYSWYFTWMVPLLCFFPNPAWLMLTILQFLSYHVLIEYGILGTWHWQPRMVFLTYAPFYALLLWQSLRKRPASG